MKTKVFIFMYNVQYEKVIQIPIIVYFFFQWLYAYSIHGPITGHF